MAAAAVEIRTAIAELRPRDVDLIVILSPHGARTGVYAGPGGSLDDFGVHGLEGEAETDRDAAAGLSKVWGTPLLDERADHGVVTPLLLMAPNAAPVIACTLVESTGPGAAPVERALDDARTFAAALKDLAAERRVLFMASANTSAALHPRAPLRERPEGRELDDAVLRALESDPGGLLDIPASLWRTAGACGAGPLTAFGTLFEGRPATVLGYAHPAGVGYLVARIDGS
ncbi:MAG: hypothetical protein ACRDJI_11455 [Actinomycetota bacterium]